jgi:NAD(P)H-hydrate epimerase
MARYELRFRASVAKDLRGIPRPDVERILSRIEALRDDPRPRWSEKLTANEHYRIRQGSYRIVYGIEDADLVVEVIKLGHRRDVYRKRRRRSNRGPIPDTSSLQQSPMTRLMPHSDRLPHALYRAEQVRALDRAAIQDHGIPGAALMERAGAAAYRLLRRRWPAARDVTVLCGVGNNAGDGYVVARLARGDGLAVRVLQLGDPAKLQGDALAMAEAWRAAGGALEPYRGLPERTDVIVDALLGTGLERDVEGQWAQAVDAANAHPAPVLAVDIPTGLHADTGRVLGTAVRAAATISFIGLKQGLFTGAGPDRCGEVHFDALQVPAVIYSREILSARRLDWGKQGEVLGPRRRGAHKGDHGHALVVGGAPGFSGAVRLAGEGALRAGAGLVTVATHPSHAALLNVGRPELMVRGVEGPADLTPLLERATLVAIGPGLDRQEWGRGLLGAVLERDLPLVADADALSLLAGASARRDDWVLTPHPGEAARLLGCSVAEVQADRFAAARRLQERFGGVVVLKGAGTLVQGASHRPPGVCSGGNPGMATGGTGDVLTGVIAALLAQGLGLEDAAACGVCLHAAAGDAAARAGERGMLAADLIEAIRPVLNSGTPLR